MRRVSYTDAEGRLKVSLIPNEAPDIEAPLGVPVGPPDLSDLGLPLEVEIRLNNQLYHRGILEPVNAIKQKQEIFSALQAALKVDAERIFGIYTGGLKRNGRSRPTEEQPNKSLHNRRPRQSR